MDNFRHRKHMEWKQNRRDIYYFILKYSKSHKGTPPTRIISDELEISMTAVQRHLRQFEDDGLIVFHGTGSHRTYELIGVKKHETV
jgi:predicted transcriptional regulator